jgi:hypothetical protein
MICNLAFLYTTKQVIFFRRFITVNNKKLIIIPPLSSFENTLGIKDRKIKGEIFILNKSEHINLYSLESSLRQLKIHWY